MNEDKQFVPVERLREAEAEIATLRESAERAKLDLELQSADYKQLLMDVEQLRARAEQAEADAERLKKRLIRGTAFLRSNVTNSPKSVWQEGYTAAIIAMADCLLFDEPAHDAGKEER